MAWNTLKGGHRTSQPSQNENCCAVQDAGVPTHASDDAERFGLRWSATVLDRQQKALAILRLLTGLKACPDHLGHLRSISISNGAKSVFHTPYAGTSLVLLWRHSGGTLTWIVEVTDVVTLVVLTLWLSVGLPALCFDGVGAEPARRVAQVGRVTNWNLGTCELVGVFYSPVVADHCVPIKLSAAGAVNWLATRPERGVS